MKLKLYLAARFTRRAEMEEIARGLEALGRFEITARWVFGGENGLNRAQIAMLDIEDVDRADIVVSFTHPRGTLTSGGGRHVEYGYALAKNKALVIIGECENVFHLHPKAKVFATLNDWLASLDYPMSA